MSPPLVARLMRSRNWKRIISGHRREPVDAKLPQRVKSRHYAKRYLDPHERKRQSRNLEAA
jgi:hypothetical protein